MLVVDDEPQILRALRATLRGAGYDVETADTAEGALDAAAAHPPEAVILDLVLPTGRNDVCRELRTWSTAPIVVLSAVGDERQKIAALDAGADDYVTKPFSVDELLARLRAVLRRSTPARRAGDRDRRAARSTSPERGDRRRRAREAQPARVRPPARPRAEPGQAAHAPRAAREVWGPAYQVEAHYLHVYVSQLRRKIEPDPSSPRYILTEPGAGYRLVEPEA